MSAIPGLVALGSVRNQAEQTMMRKPSMASKLKLCSI